MADDDTVAEENILYDLTIHAEWQQEPEQVVIVTKCGRTSRSAISQRPSLLKLKSRGTKEKKTQVPLTGRLSSAAQRSAWTVMRSIGIQMSSGSPCSLHPGLVKLVNGQMYWQIAVSCDGRYAAILQDQCIEIRGTRDDFSTNIGRCQLLKDQYPQWRKLAWSAEGYMLACSDSSGKVFVFDVTGGLICMIPADSNQMPNTPIDLSYALAGLSFKPYQGQEKWSAELFVVNFQGRLRKFLVSDEGVFKLQHTFMFTNQYARGVSAFLYEPVHSLLIVGGCGDQQSQEGGSMDAAAHGITAWRILSDYPHYKLVTDYEQDLRRAQGRSQLVKRLKSFKLYGWSTNENEDGVFKLSLSPDGKSLAAVHFSGSYSLWEVPSLRLKKHWPLETQPSHDEVNPNIAENPKRRKQMKEHVSNFLITDSNWWSNKAVILARGTGALCVSSAKTLKNLLGVSPEWFEPAPLVTVANEGGFLGLECDCRFSSLKRRLVEEEQEEEYEYEDSEDEADASLMHKGTKYMKHVLYYVTDSVRFQPPRKRPKIVAKTYRLVCLKSTTPEELYARKIDNEEYGEALSLAKAYGLDCDLVYQRQWRKTPVSVASITDYLSKISKRSWVLHECLQRVPENIDAMRALLQYALRGTDLEALKAIGQGEDGGRFILCDVEEEYEESINEFDTEAIEEAKERKKQRRRELAAEVDFKNLTLEQKELCRSRMKILQYLDRLSTYEEILGGLHAAEERYDPKFFEDFRSQNIVEITTNYARACDWRALDTVFTYHTEQVVPHRLAVLSNFPETFSPKEYRELLPEAGTREDDPEVLEWESCTWRDEDWCEFNECRANIQTEYPDLGAYLYEDNPEYKDFYVYPLTKRTLTDWYSFRAKEIERLSRQVDHSLELIRHGMERYVEGLEDLHDDMITMETLVYDCLVDDSVTFEKFQNMSDIEKVRLMMSKSSDAMYVKNVRRWLVPFLERCNKKNPNSFETLMREYLVTMAKDDLSNCLKVFQSSKADQPMPVIKDENLLMSLALECVYACESDSQLSNAFAILECLPERGIGVVRMDLHNQVDDLECHLSAADILQSNELPQTIAYIRDSQNDEEETKKLITKLTRIAGRKKPYLKEKEWTTLLMDVLDLQSKTYRCVSPKTCCEIYCQSLLCSSRHENIRLAGERMERSAVEALEPDYDYKEPDYLSTNGNSHQIPKVDYKTSKELVLSSAREYFDSSANLTDPCMDLARACLSLISDRPKEIVEEADLIDALALLDGFGVSMLPIQVRMCKDKLELVQKAIDAKPFTYKNSQRLLKLGRLLKVSSETDIEREGKILQLVAKAALKNKDYKISYDTCLRLMETSFAPIWRECKQLAEAEEFQDIKAKTDLLSFAVTYCTPEMIEPCLRAKCLLETQILYEKVHHQVSDRDSKSPGETPFSARGAIHQTKEILTSTSKTTKTVISHVSDKKWWKKTLRNLHPLRGASLTDEWDDLNEKMEKQGYHPFYESLIENGYSNKSEGDYKNCRLPKLELCDFHMNESVLRTAKLEETLTEGETIQPSSDVLLHLAEECIAQDNTLGLGYLLALPKAEDADACFDKNPRTALSLQLATYYYALQIYGNLQNESQPTKKALYTCNPQSVIQVVLDYIESSKDTDWPEEVKDMVKRLKHYQELLIDYNQAKILQGLDKGVDVARFTQDNEYKHETILGLAMSLEDSVYDIAVSLAERYELSLWEVYMTHLEALFDSGMTTQEIEEKVKKLAFLAALMDKPDEFYARMKKYVYPNIEGTDHQRLMYFYSLLEHIEGDGPIPPATHVKLIKKIKPAAPGLDYKKLTDGKHNPLEVIQPILKEGNVHVIAKMANKIPDAHGGSLHPSLIFCAWAIKMFWKFGKDDRERPQSTSEWIHHYEICSDYLQKLLPEDVIQFIDGIVFVQEGIESLEVECRQEIVRRALKYSRQQGGKKKKMNDSEGNMTWDEASQHFQQSLNHLEKLQNETIIALQQSEDKALQKYAMAFDMSRSEPEKLKKMLIEVVLDGQTPDLLDDLLQVITVDKWGVQTAVKEATRLITHMLSDSENADPLLQGKDPLSKLEGIVSSVSEHRDAGGDLVSPDDIMAVLRPFCADTSVAVKPRLDVLQILEQSFKLTQDDLVLLVLYRTEAVISTGWSEKTLNEEQVATEDKRHQLFTSLLQESEELEQFTALANLLKVWPPFQPREGNIPAEDVWCSLMKVFVETCGPGASKEVVDIMKYLQEKQFLDDDKIQYVFDLLCKNELPLSAVKAVLVNEQSSLFEAAVELLGKQEVCEDEELLQLLLQRHLTSSVVSTNYYAPLIDYVLCNQDPNQEPPYHMNVENIAFQLEEAGYKAEAGSLLLQYKGTHPAMRTFDVAMGVLSKWLSR